MQLKECFNGLLEYKKQYGACAKTIHEYQIHLKGTLLTAVGNIELADIKQADVAKVLEAGRNHGRFGPLRGAVVFRQLLRLTGTPNSRHLVCGIIRLERSLTLCPKEYTRCPRKLSNKF